MSALEKAWYRQAPWLILLLPFSCLFGAISRWRKRRYRNGHKPVWKSPVPVIVVGNISVGGTGKTPLVIALIKALQEKGYKPGVVSRGYGALKARYPQWVTATTSVEKSGDEALLIARNTGAPVVIDPDRPRAIQTLLASNDCNLIISDDGLQHYAMGRHIEIAVIDGKRGLGNGYLFPAGPLREPPERLREVDLVVVNGEPAPGLLNTLKPHNNRISKMQLLAEALVSLSSEEHCALDAVTSKQTVHAVAGIGNPQRFFDSLQKAGFGIIPHALPDHHVFKTEDLLFGDELEIIMTEKDAVKCTGIAPENTWYLKVKAELAPEFIEELYSRLQTSKSR